ncbi:hypothetical protein KP509_14G004800 [Ceratopteris richardii]|uniref:NADP-dependent oxidoreductase domain-containing protein n=1 Tax=Ceratopteris richardii TaxID=49495 RepID=A0A8T2T7J9_CERRI|nr:hypothetical protein KP509_14G004800 [Ceratopteris richardii]
MIGETYINPWLKTRARDKVIIATKVAGFSDRETSLRDKGKGTRVDASNIKESVEKSLKRLGTDYIDLAALRDLLQHMDTIDDIVQLVAGTGGDKKMSRGQFEEILKAHSSTQFIRKRVRSYIQNV